MKYKNQSKSGNLIAQYEEFRVEGSHKIYGGYTRVITNCGEVDDDGHSLEDGGEKDEDAALSFF